MRLLAIVCVVAGCTKEQPDPPRYEAPPPVDALVGPRPVIVDAPTPIPDAETSRLPIDVPVLAMVGPYTSLEASCLTAKGCGATKLDADGMGIDPPAAPDCSAVLDPSRDPTSAIPHAFPGRGTTELVHDVPGGEIRIGGVLCEVPEGARGDSSDHYVFIKRADGWWRTERPVFQHNYNEKYCGAGMYVMWNIRGPRTILGIAGSRDCLACSKQRYGEDVSELMVRVETAGAKPRVFAPLPVGTRYVVRDEFHTGITSNDIDCKVGTTSTSLTETWVSDTEVILDGPAAASGTPLSNGFTMGGLSIENLARPGRYRFPR